VAIDNMTLAAGDRSVPRGAGATPRFVRAISSTPARERTVGPMAKYYVITLKNARAYEARDVRLDGLPLTNLNTIVAPGRLEFVALPTARSGPQHLAGFKSMCGLDVEVEISYPEIPGRRCTLGGRVISAVVGPARPAPSEPPTETVTFVYERITRDVFG